MYRCHTVRRLFFCQQGSISDKAFCALSTPSHFSQGVNISRRGTYQTTQTFIESKTYLKPFWTERGTDFRQLFDLFKQTLTFFKKTLTFFKKTLTFFQRDVAKFSLSLDFF